MRRVIQLCAMLALTAAVASSAAAQPPGPGRNYVKELLLHLPSWVQAADGAWEGMRETGEGWEPTGDAIETSEPIWNHRTKQPYTRSIYRVTFKETPPPTPQARTYTATVVFEDFGQNVQIPPPPRSSPRTEWRSKTAPVLVSQGEQEIEQPPVRKSRWEYEELN